MSRTRALLKFGLWPAAPASIKEPTELTPAARAQGERAIMELDRLGVTVKLEGGKARFRSAQLVMPAAARRIIEAMGDLIEATLINGEGRL